MKFRIKFVPQIGYFSQVKEGFFSGWKKIGKHPTGYGLYSSNCHNYPMGTEQEALERCKLYEQWGAAPQEYAQYIDV